ncbi:MAG: 7-cyano-7-deazaguanine synthase QueC [Omnitrophica WOR_2 bacterium GWB2_45_9]|nr:MAG: 7-cyano-7-deazaguanine synthase QueC [Omnitrophica WOR_2 bacterium GWB2_45_9]HBU08934.1 7-cyano-7-deazaguanine synthase QueC [Candidatus Omnitrophota bacterium]
MSKKAVVLLSGGLDSATTLYFAKAKGFQCYCLIFDYGQRHKKEIASAKKIAQRAGCAWQIIKLSLPWKGSSLLDKKLKIPEFSNSTNSINLSNSIPLTYVPARNIIFLSFALSCAEAIKASSIFIGANAIDYSGYPDCRPEFYRAFIRAVNLGTKAGVEGRGFSIFTPLIKMTKAGIIKLGTRLKVPYELTWSCYQGGRKPCGKCDSCNFRARGFQEAGYRDPLLRGVKYDRKN